MLLLLALATCASGTQNLTDPVWAFGASVAGVGDVDGDGTPDVAVGAPEGRRYYAWVQGSRGERRLVSTDRGSAFVLSGRDGSVVHAWVGDEDGDRFGSAVEGLGDVDGDGCPDVAVGAPGGPYVRLFSGLDGSELDTLGAAAEGYGSTLSASASRQLAVGAPGSGTVWLHTFDDRPPSVFAAAAGELRFGAALDASRDVDGDGVADLVVGAPGGPDEEGPGRAVVFSGASGAALARFDGDEASDRFGAAVCALEGAVCIGAPGVDRVAVVALDGARRFVRARTPVMEGNFEYGAALAAPGDVDGDGAPDLFVGSPTGFWNGGLVGEAELVSGVDGRHLQHVAWEYLDERDGWAPWSFGAAVDVAGDLDGDGVNDLVVGAPDRSLLEGAVQVVSGRTGDALFQVRANRLALE